MFQHYRRMLIAATVVLGCLMTCLLGLEIYDKYADRSRWETRNGSKYYTDFYGEPASGWQQINGDVYYFGLNHAMYTGWLEAEDARYYFDSDGVMHTGWLDTDTGRYYFDTDGHMYTGWLETESGSYLLREDGTLHTGWLEQDGVLRYISRDGTPHSGWLTLESGSYYLNSDGTVHTGFLETEDGSYYFADDGLMHTGWLEQGEYRYYFLEDGTMAVSPTQIDDRTYYFAPNGIHVILVNRDHAVPEDYVTELIALDQYFQVDALCLDSLMQMMEDCRAAGHLCMMNSAYRTLQDQWGILNGRTLEYMEDGLPYEDALAATLLSVAYPGTSEHHLGLAVDIDGGSALKWLREHCWEYGFILRYPEGKTHITGIIYEPWHFRYVGTEVSMDMKDTGLCLEEYLGAYVPDDAGNP